jgi:hypothetical protein
MQSKGVFDLASELGFDTVVFDELGADGWVPADAPDSHWRRGFSLARPAVEAQAIVQTCNLKTHRYGGHFTLSLKNSVGLAAKSIPGEGYNYMTELHDSRDQRRMIAEINAAYAPALIVLDGVEAFTSGGPDTGNKVEAGVILPASIGSPSMPSASPSCACSGRRTPSGAGGYSSRSSSPEPSSSGWARRSPRRSASCDNEAAKLTPINSG